MSDNTPDDIQIRRADDHFEATENGRRLAATFFHADTGGRLVFTHTETAPEAEGRGVASRLVQAALDDVRSTGGHVVAQCSFVAHFIETHPDYADLTG